MATKEYRCDSLSADVAGLLERYEAEAEKLPIVSIIDYLIRSQYDVLQRPAASIGSDEYMLSHGRQAPNGSRMNRPQPALAIRFAD